MTVEGPSYKDQVRDRGAGHLPLRTRQEVVDSSLTGTNEPPPAIPLAEALPVNASGTDRNPQGRLLELEEERLQLERERLQLLRQQLGCGFTRKQWVFVGLLLVIVAISSVAFVFATGIGTSSQQTSNEATSLTTDRAPVIQDHINSVTLTPRPLSYPSQASPDEEALLWLIEQDVTTDASDTLSLQQRFVLATIWFANGPFDADHTDTWLTSAGECQWESVASCVNGEITSLLLESDGLKGSIPVNLGLLTALTNLVLWGNQLTGKIPSQLGLLTLLTNLSLLENRFTGSIPSHLGKLTALTRLNLSENELNGQIPTHILSLTSMTSFTVYDNNLTGMMPFCDDGPSRFGGLLSADCNEVACDCCTRCCSGGLPTCIEN